MLKKLKYHLVNDSVFYYSIIIFFITEILINPTGEFPINDDWSFNKPVIDWINTGKFTLVDWGAMTLVAQILYGFVFCKIMGTSFLTLRLSSIFLTLVSICCLYYILKKNFTTNKQAIFCFLILFSLNPFILHFSNSFMTEIPFMGFVIFSVFFLMKFIENVKIYFFLLFLLSAVISILIRQFGLCLSLSFLIYAVLFNRKQLKYALISVIISLVTIWLYEYIIHLSSFSLSYFQSSGGTINRLIEMGINNYLFYFFLRFGIFILYCSFFSSPILIGLALQKTYEIKILLKSKYFWIGFIPFILLLIRCFMFFPTENILHVGSIGAPTLMEEFSGYPMADNNFGLLFYRCWAMLSSLILFFVFAVYIISSKKEIKANFSFLKWFAVFFILVYFGVLGLTTPVFDRHFLPPFVIFLFLLASIFYELELKIKTPTYVFLFLISYYAIVSNIDFFVFNRAKWQLISKSTNELKIKPIELHGSVEFIGFYLYDKHPQDWHKLNQKYAIATLKLQGYHIVSCISYYSLLNFTNKQLFLIKKDN
jgi:4-amino-4-deoxy-L-arabinose transferase-like glycosyltransferase